MIEDKLRTNVNILIVDNDEDDVLIVKYYLQRSLHHDYHVTWCSHGEEALQAILSDGHDLALVDCYLQNSSGLTLIQQAIASDCKIPLIAFTSQSTHDLDQAALEAGAHDYLIKDTFNSDVLERTIRYALAQQRETLQLKQQQAEQKDLAEHDALTGLHNRLYLTSHLPKILSRARRQNIHVAVFFLDLNNFKQTNDQHGHDVGDQLLKESAHRLQGKLRETDYCFRLGGDEFVVVIEGDLDPEKIAIVAYKIKACFQAPFELDACHLSCAVSIGVATSFRCGWDSKVLLQCADKAMYAAKRQPQVEFQFFTPALNKQVGQLSVQEDYIQELITGKQIQIGYRPITRLFDGQLISVEVVPFAKDREQAQLSYDTLIHYAQTADLMKLFMDHVIKSVRLACEPYLGQVPFTLMLPRICFQRQHLFDHCLHRLQPLCQTSTFCLAIDQTVLQRDPSYTLAQLTKAQALQVEIMLDGLGEEALALQQLPLWSWFAWRATSDCLALPPEQRDPLIAILLALAQSCQQELIMPNIKTSEERNWVIEQGVRLGQIGELWSDPALAKLIR